MNSQNTTTLRLPILTVRAFERFSDLFSRKKHTEKVMTLRSRVAVKDDLQDSIVYARRIQEGMMLKEKHLYRLFPDAFLLFQPRDQVSGDFYWFAKCGNKIIIAAADCTGHGIPGAFMSVLGISLMNQIILEENQCDPSLILQRLDHKLRKAFGYSQEPGEEASNQDGMDIALAVIDKDAQTISFSGAYRPLYLVGNNKLKEFKGSRFPIGGLVTHKPEFSVTLIHYSAGDKLYLCSDGYADQFGGPNNKKYLSRNLKNELLKTCELSMHTQRNELLRKFNEWKNNSEQTDDVLIIGIRL
jgi:serine phosphatase RsbU (regulator of sigma subunit)